MKTVILVAAVMVVIVLPATAQSSGVGLGVAAGVAFPEGSTEDIGSSDWEGSFNWGFYVNIPLIATFHLTPSSELYKMAGDNATDMSIAFKFIVPLSRFDIFAGFAPGLTAVGSTTAPHVGVLGGVSLPLVGNLDAFAGVKYKILFQGNENIRVLHVNAGILFLF